MNEYKRMDKYINIYLYLQMRVRVHIHIYIINLSVGNLERRVEQRKREILESGSARTSSVDAFISEGMQESQFFDYVKRNPCITL